MKLTWKVIVVCFLLLTSCTLFALVRRLRKPRIENPWANAGAFNDRFTLPAIARNVTHHQGQGIERVNSTANKSTNAKISRTPLAGFQTSEVEGRKQSEMDNVVGIKKMSNITEVQTSSDQKQETHHVQQHKSEKSGIASNQTPIGTMAKPPPKNSLTSNQEQFVEIVMQRQNSEAARNKIMLTIRTTMSFHKKRLPVLFDTWLTKANASNVFLVTDGIDKEYIRRSEQLGVHYINVWCGTNYSRWSLCCKSGEEMSLMFQPEYQYYDWYCHMDDDIYLIEDNLVDLLAYFDAKKDLVYLGRAGTYFDKPYKLNPRQTLINGTNLAAHFAVGGMYCISRPLLEKARPWLGSGKKFGDVCERLLEPEDVTVGAVMGLLLKVPLSRTHKIHGHGLILKTMVDSTQLKSQVAIAYGCGQLCFIPSYKDNAIRVPNAKFPQTEDPSRFRSLHCHLYPETDWCLDHQHKDGNEMAFLDI